MVRTLLLLGVLVAALFAATVAGAGNPSLCAKGGWQSAQSDNGSAFSSHAECAKARSVYAPVLQAVPQSGSAYSLSASGFHPAEEATLTFSIAVVGTVLATFQVGSTDAAGSLYIPGPYYRCLDLPIMAVTITVSDSSGVHASTGVAVC